MYGYNVTSLSAVCMRACFVLDKCSHCTLFTFRWFQCLSAFMSTLHIPGRTPIPLLSHPILTTRTCFIARTMLAITFLSSITMDSSGVSSPLWTEASPGEEAHTFRWFTLIKLMEWNACVRVCACFNSDSDSDLVSDYFTHYPTLQKFTFLAGKVTRQHARKLYTKSCT